MIAIVLLATPRCIGYDAGIEVSVAFRAEAASWVVELPDGRRLRFDRAELAVGGVELVPCETHATLLGPARALAHGVETTSGIRLDLLHDGGLPRSLPPSRLPPDRYCALRVHFEPLEPDGATLRIEAREEGAAAISITDERPCDVELPFETPLVLDEPGHVAVMVDFDPWGWPMAELSAEQVGAMLVRDARVSICRDGTLEGC